MNTKMIVFSIGMSALLVGSCSNAEPGSHEDLAARLDSLEVPASMIEMEERYTGEEECTMSVACPMLVRWYDIPGPVEAARSTLISQLRGSGFDVQVTPDPNLATARRDGYIYFLAFNSGNKSSTDQVPAHIEADLSVSQLATP